MGRSIHKKLFWLDQGSTQRHLIWPLLQSKDLKEKNGCNRNAGHKSINYYLLAVGRQIPKYIIVTHMKGVHVRKVLENIARAVCYQHFMYIAVSLFNAGQSEAGI